MKKYQMTNQTAEAVEKSLRTEASEQRAKDLSRFFKTGKGDYGEGDVFLGVSVPQQREVAKGFTDCPLSEIARLLESSIHECRLTGLIILVSQFKKASEEDKKKIFEFYFKHSKKINNWDLVDLSAHKIVGEYLLGKDVSVLNKLATSDNLWQRRISIIATFAFINKGQFNKSLELAQILLHDRHDLIQKAVGWMLREIGKRDEKVLIQFLDKHAKTMPRTMLRYAIEKLDEKKKKFYLAR